MATIHSRSVATRCGAVWKRMTPMFNGVVDYTHVGALREVDVAHVLEVIDTDTRSHSRPDVRIAAPFWRYVGTNGRDEIDGDVSNALSVRRPVSTRKLISMSR
jgi:hypothetical protein